MASARSRVAVVLTALLAAAATVAALVLLSPSAITAGCTAAAGSQRFVLDPAQAQNATTIAAEAFRQGLPDHAVSVGLAAALQESKLRNLTYGDRDSLGLFQQRPSQGWGTPTQLTQPRYAAAAFFRALRHVAGWQAMPIYLAAQRVQRSASVAAYAAWDTESRTIARGLTGETPAGFTCRFPSVGTAQAGTSQQLATHAAQALGSAPFAPADAAHGWVVATWLVARAPAYSLSRVTFAGWTWTPHSKAWQRDTGGATGVTYALRGA